MTYRPPAERLRPFRLNGARPPSASAVTIRCVDLGERLLADVTRRFWSHVGEMGSGCWLWEGAGAPYGHIRVAGTTTLAHRLSWELANGTIPDGMQVCHSCDVPLCVRSDHLFLCTQSENLLDAVAKGRSSLPEQRVRGEQHHQARLTEDAVLSMRHQYGLGGVTLKELAKRFGVGVSTVHDVVSGKKWKHLPLAGAPAA